MAVIPQISVIIPTYNRAVFLEKAIGSVLSQTFRDYELIIVDDGSTDVTAGCVKKSPCPITYIYQENQGAAAARNTGIRAARAPLLAFLDSDDCFAPRKLELQRAAMLENSQYLVSHTQELWYRQGKILNQKKKHAKDHGYIFHRCLALCAVGMSTIMAHRRLFDQIGLFTETLPCCEDYDLWLRTSVHHPFFLVDHPLTIKDGGRADQLSVQYRVGMDKYRIESILSLLNSDSLSPEQRQLAQNEFMKKCRIYGNGCLKHGRLVEGRYYLSLMETQMNVHS